MHLLSCRLDRVRNRNSPLERRRFFYYPSGVRAVAAHACHDERQIHLGAGFGTRGTSLVRETGVEFDVETWDGSDFFCAEGTFAIMCTERMKNILEENKITNLKLGRNDEIEWYSL